MTSTPYLRQADPAWTARALGLSAVSPTIGRSGCLLTAITQAVRALGVDVSATPVAVQERAISHWRAKHGANPWLCPFVELPPSGPPKPGPNAVLDLVAEAAGLHSDPAARVDNNPELMQVVLDKTLLNGGLCILHVDYDGDGRGDHFALALRIDDDKIHYADPATGTEGRIDLRSLVTAPGGHSWGQRVYRVRSVRPVYRRVAPAQRTLL